MLLFFSGIMPFFQNGEIFWFAAILRAKKFKKVDFNADLGLFFFLGHFFNKNAPKGNTLTQATCSFLVAHITQGYVTLRMRITLSALIVNCWKVWSGAQALYIKTELGCCALIQGITVDKNTNKNNRTILDQKKNKIAT